MSNRQLRDAVGDFAADSRHASPGPRPLTTTPATVGKDHRHAVRILARDDLRHLALLARTAPPTTLPSTTPHGAHPGPARCPQGRSGPPRSGKPMTGAITAALRLLREDTAKPPPNR